MLTDKKQGGESFLTHHLSFSIIRLLLAGLFSFALGDGTLYVVGDRRSYEQRRERTDDNTHQQCEYEATDALTTEYEDGQQDDER